MVDSIHIDLVLCLRCQVSQGEVVSGRGQPLVLGPPATRLLVVEAVARNGGGGSQPVNGEGVGLNVREVQASGGIQSYRVRYWRLRGYLQ